MEKDLSLFLLQLGVAFVPFGMRMRDVESETGSYI